MDKLTEPLALRVVFLPGGVMVVGQYDKDKDELKYPRNILMVPKDDSGREYQISMVPLPGVPGKLSRVGALPHYILPQREAGVYMKYREITSAKVDPNHPDFKRKTDGDGSVGAI